MFLITARDELCKNKKDGLVYKVNRYKSEGYLDKCEVWEFDRKNYREFSHEEFSKNFDIIKNEKIDFYYERRRVIIEGIEEAEDELKKEDLFDTHKHHSSLSKLQQLTLETYDALIEELEQIEFMKGRKNND